MIYKNKLITLIKDKHGTYINIHEILNCFKYKDTYKTIISDIIKSEGPEEYDDEISGTANDEQWISSICVKNHERDVLIKGTIEALLDEYKGTIKDFSNAIEVIVETLRGGKNES